MCTIILIKECILTARSRLQDFFAKWGQEGTIDFAKTFSELIILTASRTLMGTPYCHCACPTRHSL